MDPLIQTVAPLVTLVCGGIFVYTIMRMRATGKVVPDEPSESERLFRLGFERAPIGIAYLSTDGSWIYANTQLLKLLGYERSEFNRTSLRMLTHSEDRKREAGMMAALRSGRSRGFTINKRLRRSDGTFRTFRFSICRVGGGGGAVFQCIIDEAEAELDRQNDLAVALDRVPEISVIGLDSQGMVTSWNRGAEELFGYSMDDMKGRPWTRLHATERGKAGEANRELALAASSGRFEGTDSRKRSDGALLSVEVVIVPRFRGKDLAGFVEICRDTALTFSAREYKSAYDRLRELNDAKIEGLTESNERMRRELDHQAELESSMRDAQERVRSANRELTGRIKILSAAVRKLIDQRNSLKETIRTEREGRPVAAEELSTNLPPDLEWSPVRKPVRTILAELEERDGVATFRSGGDEKRFTIRSRSVVTCSSNSAALLLGQLLVDEGLLSEEDRRKMIDVQEETGIAFGRLLVLFELIPEEQVALMMKKKICREIDELERWAESEYTFMKGTFEPLQIIPVEVDVTGAEIGSAEGSEGVGEKEIDVPPDAQEEELQAHVAVEEFVSSASAKKFHLKDCPVVKRISKQSMIVFQSTAAAEENGLSACRKCLGSAV